MMVQRESTPKPLGAHNEHNIALELRPRTAGGWFRVMLTLLVVVSLYKLKICSQNADSSRAEQQEQRRGDVMKRLRVTGYSADKINKWKQIPMLVMANQRYSGGPMIQTVVEQVVKKSAECHRTDLMLRKLFTIKDKSSKPKEKMRLLEAGVDDLLWTESLQATLMSLDRFRPGNGSDQLRCVIAEWGDMADVKYSAAWRSIAPSAFFLFLIRDGRDVATSIHKFTHEKFVTLESPANITWQTVVVQWRSRLQVVKNFCKTHRRCLFLRYEDLVFNTPDAIQSVADFVRLRPDVSSSEWRSVPSLRALQRREAEDLWPQVRRMDVNHSNEKGWMERYYVVDTLHWLGYDVNAPFGNVVSKRSPTF